MNHPSAAWATLRELRAAGPLVHNITNYVAMDVTANALLAAGASPAMVHAAEEVEEFVGIAQAVVVNIGTLSRAWVAAMALAADSSLGAGEALGARSRGGGCHGVPDLRGARAEPRRPHGGARQRLGDPGARRHLGRAHPRRGQRARVGERAGGGAGAGGGARLRGRRHRRGRLRDGRRAGAERLERGSDDDEGDGAGVRRERADGRVPRGGARRGARLGAGAGRAGPLRRDRRPPRPRGPGSLRWRLIDALHGLDEAAMQGVRIGSA